MLYGAQIWGIGLNNKPIAKRSLVPLDKLQNQCLYRITGVYKRTLYAAMEHKAAVPPLNVYIDTTAMQRAATVQKHLVEKNIHQMIECIQRVRPY